MDPVTIKVISDAIIGAMVGLAVQESYELAQKKIQEIIEEAEENIKTEKQISSEIEKNLKVLNELEKKQFLTIKEQKKLNKVLEYFKKTDIRLANSYEKFKMKEISYADYLSVKDETKTELDLRNYIIDSQEKYLEYEKEYQKLLSDNSKYEHEHRLQVTPKLGKKMIGGKNKANIKEADRKVVLESIENMKKREGSKGKNEELERYIKNEKRIKELENLKQTVIKDVEEKNIINNTFDNEKEKKIIEKKANKNNAEEKYKQEELEINAEYNREVLDETEDFNEKMKELLKSRNINEIQEAKKNHEEKLKTFEEKNKIELLEHQKNKPGATKIDIENLDTKIKMLKVEAEKEKNINKINQIEIEIKASEEAKLSNVNNTGTGLKNLTSMFQMLGDVTGKQSIKDISNVLGTGSSLFEAFKNTSIGAEKLAGFFGDKAIPGFENFNQGMGIGNIISGALGGGTEGNLGSMIGSGIGTAVGGPVGSIVGGAIGSIGGSIFGSKSKKKKKREERKRKAAQERLQRGLISGQYKWQDVVEAYNEDLLKLGTGSYIDLYDKVSANTDYDNILSSLNGAKSGSDGVSMTTLKQLMPQYNEQQIIDWFKSLTGGAVLKGDILSTGEGKYGAIDIGELAKQVTNTNRDLEKTLKTTIKGIINFSADSLAEVVKKGFFGGMEDLGNNIESMLAESLKNAFVNTEISKSLFNGLSDKVSDVVKDMFVKDGNLGINLEIGELENLSLTQYIELIKKYTETSNEKLEELFRELGLNMDNLTGSMNTLNKNMSKNTVQGMATNLWRYNLGQNVTSEFNGVFEVEIPIILGDQLLDKRIIKITSDSIRKARRNKF
ncbi:MAG: hypothetical protein OGM09_01425 [Fusobacterium varium]|uniref:hypothetical protein n=1 Tax=Fusobacterium varium TaxID=856 RepID=UPI00242BA933|nr:hypothetical protein [Fusobacterium varium]UYI78905.1 MAG: hypothetical protein OGM09_01425 [Fusobacterium varium]